MKESFWVENISDVENMGNTIEDLRNEESHGEMNYISKDGVERSIRESESDSMSEEKNENNIAKNDEEVGSEFFFE